MHADPSYEIGMTFTWWRFSSCTTNGEVLENPLFLGQAGERTLFSIDCKTGVSIQHLSAYKTEAEILMRAGSGLRGTLGAEVPGAEESVFWSRRGESERERGPRLINDAPCMFFMLFVPRSA